MAQAILEAVANLTLDTNVVTFDPAGGTVDPAMITVDESELRYVDEQKNSMANPAFEILATDDEDIIQPSFTINESNSFNNFAIFLRRLSLTHSLLPPT